jgi:amino acid adenylation domain-containing protein
VETPFDLERPPLFRTLLVRVDPELHVFVLCAHHVVCDGWSAGVLVNELAALYKAGAANPAVPLTAAAAGLPPPSSFAAYASALRERAETPEGAADEAYWVKRLAGDLKQIELPTDRAAPPRRTYAAARLDLALDPKLLAPLRQLGAKAGCTFLVTLMGALQAWLLRLTGESDLIIGVPTAGQAAVGAESLVGHCVHVLPIRATVDGNRSFLEHLASFKPVMLDAFDYQQVTFSSLLRKLNMRFDPSRMPLIPVCLNVDVGLEHLDFGPLAVTCESVPRSFESFELFLNAVDYRSRLVMEWSYNTALFDESTIRRWMHEIETMVADILAHPTTRLKDLAVLAPEEIDVLAGLNATDRTTTFTPVHEQIAAHAAASPDRPAVRFAGRTLSYADLERSANRLAHRLRSEGVRERDCVGVCLNRSELLPVALLAVMKCGAAYVPMDPGYPVARLAMMAEDGKVRLIVTDGAASTAAPSVERTVRLDTLTDELAREPETTPGITIGREDSAYVLFTSGSTGRPKGVAIPHRALVNFLRSMQREPGFGPDDRLLAVTTISFDIAGLELFLPLVSGGTVVIADRRESSDPSALGRMMEREDITVMQATPATWRMLIDAGWSGRPQLRVLCGGEAFPAALVGALLSRTREVWNMYGPTETTIWSTVERMEPDERVTIGHPIDNTRVYVLDANLIPVPLGASGELWIAGEGVALGYIGREELTRERFLDSPFIPGERIYRTGDLGRILPNGDIECLGRSDFQVKVRGFRIELGEIEAVAERLPGVRKAVVSLFEQGGLGPQLAVYWVPEPGDPVDQLALRTHLQGALPPYMVPQHYVALDALPLTPAGKVDRKSLPPPKVQTEASGTALESLRDDVDVAVAEIWQELLGVSEIGIEDDFFALGGHSLLAVRFVSAVESKLGVPFTLTSLFSASTLRQVADAIRSGGGQFERGAIALRRDPGAPRIFFICGVHMYRTVAVGLGPGIESYGVVVTADELLAAALHTNLAPDLDVAARVQEYLDAIRSVQAHGPYHLAGVSFGGVLAYEIARALRKAGEEVHTLALLDPILPTSVHTNRLGQLEHLIKADRIWSLGERLAKSLFRGGRNARHDSAGAPHADAAQRLAELRDQQYTNAIAEWDKTAPTYDGDALLFRATDATDYPGLTIDRDLGWQRLIKGRLSIHDLPGSHLGILRPPSSHRLTAILRDRIIRRASQAHVAVPTPAGPEAVPATQDATSPADGFGSA